MLYGAALVPYLVLRLRHRRQAREDVLAPPALDLYERAYLTGGPQRVALTALIAMNEAERVRLLDDGRVEPVEHAAGRLHPVEQALVNRVRSAAGLPAGALVNQVQPPA